MDDELKAILNAGWNQGSLIYLSREDRDLFGLVGSTDLYIVASHPCDVVSQDFERDPIVELLPIRQIEAMDGNFAFGKNPRKLQVAMGPNIWEIETAIKVSVPRTTLSSRAPVETMQDEDRKLFARWLSDRYARSVFATEFNNRLASVSRKIESLVKRASENISGVYVAVSSEELAVGQNYEIVIVVTMRSAHFSESGRWTVVSEIVDKLSDVVRECEGIVLLDCRVVSESDMSLENLRQFARWDYAYMSVRAQDFESLPPQGS